MLLPDKVAIITGGATGIGRSIASRFADEGCDIAVADINMKDAHETIDGIKKSGRKGLALECDISDSCAVHRAVNQVISELGKVEILVNNAGGTSAAIRPSSEPPKQRSIANISDEEWERVLAVNLKGAFLFCRETVPYMKKQRYGKIINVSSLGWINPPAVAPHYHAAKAGIVGMTNDMACELSPQNIHVNAILPGPIRTPFYDSMLSSQTDEEKDAFFQMLGSTVPLQRVGTPEEIAGVALFLASELSSFVTGTSIPVGGGIPLKPNAQSPMVRAK